uniref:Uncharacterized protein n=1 Tax=Haemonchus contortus TaxID=6289 RepID=A0A7I4YQV2_HAECO
MIGRSVAFLYHH